MKSRIIIRNLICLTALVLTADVLQAQSTWQKTDFPQTGLQTHHILATDNALIAGTYRGLHISYDSGQSWIQDGDMRRALTGGDPFIALAVNENYLFTLDNLFLKRFAFPVEESASQTMTLPKNSAGDTPEINDLVSMGNALFAATNGGVFKSTDNAQNWAAVTEIGGENNGSAQVVNKLIAVDDTLFAGTNDGIYRSDDAGDTWEVVELEEDIKFEITQYINHIGGQLFATTKTGYYSETYFYSSDDFGRTWTEVGEEHHDYGLQLYAFAILDDVYFAVTQTGLLISMNFGEEWEPVSENISENNADFNTLAVFGGYLYAGTDAGLYRSNTNAASWEQLAVKRYLSVNALAADADNNMLYAEAEGSIYRSADLGESWNEFYKPSAGDNAVLVPAIKIWDDYLIAGSENGLYRAKTSGETAEWEKVLADSSGSAPVRIFTVWQDTLYTKVNKRLYQSGDYGSSWNLLSESLLSSSYMDRYGLLAGYDGYLYSANENGFLRSNDSGRTWESTGRLGNYVVLINDFIKSDGELLAAAEGTGIYVSTDNGSSWIGSNYGMPGGNNSVSALIKHNDLLYADLYVSENNGLSWTMVQTGIENEPVRAVTALQAHDDFLFAGTSELGVIKRSLNAEAVPITDEPETVSSFELHQNYPNPFNPATTITFSIKEKAFVTLKVYDVTGREVAVLVSDNMPAGTYNRIWNAGRLASGIYFYKLTAGSFTQTRKLTLLK